MTDPQGSSNTANGRANARIVAMCLGLVAGMGGLAYASVPLYQLFCKVTGYGGTTRQAVNADGVAIVDRDIVVRFDANTAPSLHWKFAPMQRDVTLKLGESRQISYVVENNTDKTLYGTATFNVTPQQMGAYFNKLECFCFTKTEVKPGERLEMPVVFFIDPEMLNAVETKDVATVTLSYTFFPSDAGEPKPQAKLDERQGEVNKQPKG